VRRFTIGTLFLGVSMMMSGGAAAPQAAGPAPTFAKDVAPILYTRCVDCHRPAMFAPMSLVTYEEVRPWARAIKSRVVKREMPPWHADAPAGVFKDDPRLSQQEIDTIVSWVDGGAPKGNAADMPALPALPAEGWTIGQPDLVLTMEREYHIPADGTVPYLNFRLPTGLTEDRWIQAYEFKPSNRAIVHHIVASAVPANAAPSAVDEAGGGRNSIGNLVPSRPGVILPAGVAKLLPANSDIVLQMHYTTNGSPQRDQTSVGLIFAKQPPKQVVGGGGSATNQRFVIPAHSGNHEVRAERTLTEDTNLLAMMPHMHVRGKDMTYVARYPDGRTETLLSVPRYDFRWQTTYEYVTPKRLPKGTVMEVIAHFDNSAANKDNPDPSQEVRWGDQTWEEMMIGATTTIMDASTLREGRASSQQ
jgi:hypothetical protein